MKKYVKYIVVMSLAVAVLGMQFGSMAAAHADTNADLTIYANMTMAETAIEVTVCNYGPSDVTQFVLNLDTTNFDVNDARNASFGDYSPNPDHGGNKGTFDFETLTWNGYLEYEAGDGDTHHERCIYIGFTGHSTGDVGTPVSITASVVSSVLSDTSVNTDPVPVNNSYDVTPFTTQLDPDIAVDTRLATTGEISPSSNVTYEATLSNIGQGAYHDNGFMLLGFVIPDGSTFSGVTDVDDTDSLSLVDSNPDPDQLCYPAGRAEDVAASVGMNALGGYTGIVIVCFFSLSEDWDPGVSYKVDVNITAGETFAAGTAEVVGLFEGNDPDTLSLQIRLLDNSNIFASGNNNIIHLTYDPEALVATAGRCEGQGETTSDGTGCFTLTFNKKVVGETFDESDIVLELDKPGAATVSSLERIDDFTWEVHVAGIPVGATVTFLLNLDGIIQDYSAVQNTAQVLGINTIRYAVDTPAGSGSASGSASGESTSANGTLATTGMHKPDFATPAMLIGLGILLAAFARRRKVATIDA